MKAIGLVVAVLLWASAPAFGQDAARLIAAVSQNASNGAMWEAEGVMVRGESGPEIPFRVSQAGNRARLEIIGGPNPLVRLCDGSTRWTYVVAEKQYWKTADAGVEWCAYPLIEWRSLARDLTAPEVIGRETIRAMNRKAECAVVRGEIPAAGRRTLWIEEPTGWVWKYRVEAADVAEPARTYTFGWQAKAGVPRTEDLWRFDAPAGALEIAPPTGQAAAEFAGRYGNMSPQSELPSSVYRIGGRVVAPRLLHKVEPKYDQAARKGRIEGTVLLNAIVEPDGKADHFKIKRSLHPGLDQKAIEAVKQWRFQPGTRDGLPVAVMVTVEVNFRLR